MHTSGFVLSLSVTAETSDRLSILNRLRLRFPRGEIGSLRTVMVVWELLFNPVHSLTSPSLSLPDFLSIIFPSSSSFYPLPSLFAVINTRLGCLLPEAFNILHGATKPRTQAVFCWLWVSLQKGWHINLVRSKTGCVWMLLASLYLPACAPDPTWGGTSFSRIYLFDFPGAGVAGGGHCWRRSWNWSG